MTSSLIQGRPRRATAHISVRVAHTLVGAVAGVLWLLLPGVTVEHAEQASTATAQDEDGTYGADLVLPLVAVGAAVVVAGYSYVRRTRRARTRTVPVGASVGPSTSPPLAELDEHARNSLVIADDCVRTSREELGFVADAVAPYAQDLRDASAELTAAFRMRQQYDDGVPREAEARRHALAGIVGRCEEAGRRLDAAAAGVDQLRGLETDTSAALEVAEARFRALAGRTQAVDTLLANLGERYAPVAVDGVLGHVEQAKDRLVFATLRLNQARQAADLTDGMGVPPTPLRQWGRAALHLRAAEGAIAQAAVLLDGVERLDRELAGAGRLVPAALTGAEAVIARAPDPTRIPFADGALAAVREEVTGGPYDPLGALRRIVAALSPLAADPSAGVLGAAALLVGRSTTAAADDFVAVHRGAVGATARTRLAEAVRLLNTAPADADTYARNARDLAERDVRAHGNPLAGAAEHESGTAGAVIGGILLPDGVATSFGGPRSRGRRAPG